MAIINVSVRMIFLSNFQVATFSFWRDFMEVYLAAGGPLGGRWAYFFIKWIFNFDKVVAGLQWQLYLYIYLNFYLPRLQSARMDHPQSHFLYFLCFMLFLFRAQHIVWRCNYQPSWPWMAISAPGHGKGEGAKYPPSTRWYKTIYSSTCWYCTRYISWTVWQQSLSMIQARTLEEAKFKTMTSFNFQLMNFTRSSASALFVE